MSPWIALKCWHASPVWSVTLGSLVSVKGSHYKENLPRNSNDETLPAHYQFIATSNSDRRICCSSSINCKIIKNKRIYCVMNCQENSEKVLQSAKIHIIRSLRLSGSALDWMYQDYDLRQGWISPPSNQVSA